MSVPILPPPINSETVEVLVNRFADIFRAHCAASGRTPASIKEALNALACVAGIAIVHAPTEIDAFDFFVGSVRNQMARIIAEKLRAASVPKPPASEG